MKTTVTSGWNAKAQERLISHASRLFAAWKQSKSGKRWLNARRKFGSSRSSPYTFGFSLPDYHHNLIEAVGTDNEETAKAIILQWYL